RARGGCRTDLRRRSGARPGSSRRRASRNRRRADGGRSRRGPRPRTPDAPCVRARTPPRRRRAALVRRRGPSSPLACAAPRASRPRRAPAGRSRTRARRPRIRAARRPAHGRCRGRSSPKVYHRRVAARLEDTLVTGYTRLALEAPRRRIDIELRLLDIAFATLFGLLLLLPALVIAALVRATSTGPVLYRGERVGRHGHFFTMLKFRTLRPDAETRLGPYLGEELVRRTEAEYSRLGRWLKASQLDEIPQLWNVLR